MVINLDEKIALITGSSSGIGAATAILFSSLGAKVVLVGRRQEQLNQVAQEVEAKSPKKYPPLVVNADLEKEEEVKRVFDETIAKYSRLDILVNNAGLTNKQGFTEEGYLEDFDRMIKINTRAPLQLSHLARPYLAEAKGCIVNVSSICSIKPIARSWSYCMAKAAMDMMTKTLALELAPDIRVNSVNPGVVKTDFGRDLVAQFGGDPAAAQAILELCKQFSPLRKIGEPIDMANLIAYLSSDAAKFMTGSIVCADGGYLVNDPYAAGMQGMMSKD